jgi:hypothetical protein
LEDVRLSETREKDLTANCRCGSGLRTGIDSQSMLGAPDLAKIGSIHMIILRVAMQRSFTSWY